MGWWETPRQTMKDGCPAVPHQCSSYVQNPGDSTQRQHSENTHTHTLQFNPMKIDNTSSLKQNDTTIAVLSTVKQKNDSNDVRKKE